MKVVLFCGGLGMRLRDHSQSVPKPLVNIGGRPILWHVMRYYAHFGHTDFILCLGYKAELIREYFLTPEHVSGYNITVNEDGHCGHYEGEAVAPSGDARDWRITFVDTGIDASVGMRLKALEPMLRGEELFLANYADGVSDLPLPAMIDEFRRRDAVAIFAGVTPTQSFHLASIADDGRVHSIEHVRNVGMRINGGFFVFRAGIFDWLQPGEELVEEPFRRLAVAGKLLAYPHDGFWACLDTFKDKQLLEDLYARGDVPWEVWLPRPAVRRADTSG